MKLVGLALALGLLIRLVGLTTLPRGFTPDEAAFGYNAYSLLTTGADEWGTQFWQLPFTNLKSFGDYKLPLYAFLDVPFVAIFGLNEFSARLPNVIISSLGVICLAICSRKLFPKMPSIGLLCSFLFALSPWSIQLSRGAFEANLITTFLPLIIGLYFSRRSFFTSFIAAISAYSYHSARLITPILLLSLFVFFPIRNRLKILVLFVLLLIPAVGATLSSGNSRVSDVSIFSPTDKWASVSDSRFEAVTAGETDILARIFSNKIISSLSLLKNNSLQYVSPQFLFSSGAGESTYGMVRGHGVLYSVEIISLVLFVTVLVKRPTKSILLLVFLVFISLIPAALAKGPGYAANRSAAMIPFLCLVSSIGISRLIHSKYKLFMIPLVTVYLFQVISFGEKYFIHSSFQTAQSMNYGWQEALFRSGYAISNTDKVILDTGLSEPQIFIAFYLHIPPKVYQEASRDWNISDPTRKFLDQYTDYSLGKFTFTRTKNLSDLSPDTLILSLPENQPKNTTESFHINHPNGQTAIVVSTPNK